MRPDARPQAWKNRRRIRWNTLRIFSGRERRRWSRIVRRSRTVNVGQAPRAGGNRWSNAQRSQTLAALQSLSAADFPLSLTTNHRSQVTVHGVDVFKPQTGEVISHGADDIACWFIDTDYNEERFFVRHAYFLGANDPYSALKTTLKAEIDPEAWATLKSDTSRAFEKPKPWRIAVKVFMV